MIHDVAGISEVSFKKWFVNGKKKKKNMMNNMEKMITNDMNHGDS